MHKENCILSNFICPNHDQITKRLTPRMKKKESQDSISRSFITNLIPYFKSKKESGRDEERTLLNIGPNEIPSRARPAFSTQLPRSKRQSSSNCSRFLVPPSPPPPPPTGGCRGARFSRFNCQSRDDLRVFPSFSVPVHRRPGCATCHRFP